MLRSNLNSALVMRMVRCLGLQSTETETTPSPSMASTTETMAGDLAPGTYTVLVTDGEGCSGEETVEVEAALAISVTTDVVDASCFEDNDGSITVNAAGGSGAFQYSEDGNNYIPNNEFGGFTAGTYTLFVQDEFGCVESGSATVGQPRCHCHHRHCFRRF